MKEMSTVAMLRTAYALNFTLPMSPLNKLGLLVAHGDREEVNTVAAFLINSARIKVTCLVSSILVMINQIRQRTR